MADCLCGHGLRDHSSTALGGRIVAFCKRCKECTGFGIIAPRPPHALLVEADAPTELGATTAGSNETAESVGAKRTLIIAWDTRWCPDCSSRYFAEDAECCGAACMPVRLEMHSREPL
jgi:hypothetical protein